MCTILSLPQLLKRSFIKSICLYLFYFFLQICRVVARERHDLVWAQQARLLPSKAQLMMLARMVRSSTTKHCMRLQGKFINNFTNFRYSIVVFFSVCSSHRSDNDRLKLQLKKKDDDLMNARSAIDRFTNAVSSLINTDRIFILYNKLITHLFIRRPLKTQYQNWRNARNGPWNVKCPKWKKS